MSIWIILLLVPMVLSVGHQCPGANFSCPDTATCCQLLDKSYGCCPLENAVCCDDHIHCCPKNTKCSASLCIQNNYANETAKRHIIENNNNSCPGGQLCPTDTTCCGTGQPGAYSCCPMKDAVCCKDGSHCCPQGTVCDLAELKCIGDGFIFQMYDALKTRVLHSNFAKFTAITVKSMRLSNVICPESSFQCPDGYTCCKLPNGDWGCCPFPKATCCKDHVHCCPENMQCDDSSQFCSQGPKNITSYKNKPAEPIKEKDVICPDQTLCDDHNTCCKIGEKRFGCCPYENANCCEDEKNCCPSDYDCDVIGKRCVPKQNWALKFLVKHFNNL